MTIAKSLLTNEAFYVDGFPVLEPAQDAPRFYRVMLQRKSDNVFVMGQVVTSLSLSDSCGLCCKCRARGRTQGDSGVCGSALLVLLLLHRCSLLHSQDRKSVV